jgi:hypothetical protein
MTHHADTPANDSPLDGAPTWLRVLQAALIGLVAGLALHLLFSMVVLQGKALRHEPPSQCKKSSPARDAAAPAKPGSAVHRFSIQS